MSVQRNGKQNCYRSEKKRDVVSADFVCIVTDSRDSQKTDDENGGDENRVQERVTPFVADGNADFKSDDGKDNSEHGEARGGWVIFPLRFYPQFLIFCTATVPSSQ